MPRSLVLSNSQLMVCLDGDCQVRDVYYPYVGLENHVMGQPHKLGVLVNGEFSWLNQTDWQIKQSYLSQTLVGQSVAVKSDRQVELSLVDLVTTDQPIFLRQITWKNTSHRLQVGKLFFHQVFFISESTKRNTAFFDPTAQALIHYKGRRVFLIGGSGSQGAAMTEYSVGAYQEDDKVGTYMDAEDGVLSQNAVEHGSVDSVFALPVRVNPGESQSFYYWSIAGLSLSSVAQVQREVLRKTPSGLIDQTTQSWRQQLSLLASKIDQLTPELKTLAETSLMLLIAHSDHDGAIIASSDSDTLQYGKDDYSYFWPRDGMYCVNTLIKAGYYDLAKKYLLFCQKVLHPDGYLHHRYRPDGSLGSTWHSSVAQTEWLTDKILQLPIQEDETAGVLITLWQYYQASQDMGLVRVLAKTLLDPICEFLLSFRQKASGLPLPSYDIWEEQSSVSTYTTSAVYAGLLAGQKLAQLLGWTAKARNLEQAADKMRSGLLSQLYSPEQQRFLRSITKSPQGLVKDSTIDSSSLFGLWYFGVIDQSEPEFVTTLDQTKAALATGPGGWSWSRYQNDAYFRRGQISNYWLITSMWECLRRLNQKEVTQTDINYVRDACHQVMAHQSQAGLLSEQLDPVSLEPLSATPLVWSHATVLEVLLLLNKTLRSQSDQPPAEQT